MLHIEKLFKDLGKEKALEYLDTLAIHITYHDTLPLMVLNYHKIDSPEMNPVARECRGLVLTTDGVLVARTFKRFFNIHEISLDTEEFDFTSFTTTEKEDGTCILLFNYGGQWLCSTRKTFCNSPVSEEYTGTFKNLLLDACGFKGQDDLQLLGNLLNPKFTYCLEVCTLHNKVVREYKEPEVFLITMFEGECELSEYEVLSHIVHNCVFTPLVGYHFTAEWEIWEYISERAVNDITFEGVVVRDKDNRRLKIKNPKYVYLHHLKTNGDISQYKLAKLIFEGEVSEFLTIFPEFTGPTNEVRDILDTQYKKLCKLLPVLNDRGLTQKEFAERIKDKTPLNYLLFNLRKLNITVTNDDLKYMWYREKDKIIKKLFKST